MDQRKINEIWAIGLIVLTVLLFISLISFDAGDIVYYTSLINSPIKNLAGIFGAYLAGIIFFIMGWSGYILPILSLIWATNRLLGNEPEKLYLKISGVIILIISSSSFFSLFVFDDSASRFKDGGLLGLIFSDFFVKYFGVVGAFIVTLALLLLSVILATEFLVFPIFIGFAKFVLNSMSLIKDKSSNKKIRISNEKEIKISSSIATKQTQSPRTSSNGLNGFKEIPKKESPAILKSSEEKSEASQKQKEITIQPKPQKTASKPLPQRIIGSFKLPSLELLDAPPPVEERKIKDNLEESSRILEETLQDFGVEAKVVRVEQGPVITRYELEPAAGVKVNKITTLNDDIALTMKAQSVRIVAPIPGKGTVGVEVPNTSNEIVYLKDVLSADDFIKSEDKLTLALGKDVAGNAVITDLASMPHLLIAGTTGSGKTVCVNTLILSLLFRYTPEDIKFIMVDPKMVELAVYNGLPHLICPVVTEPKKVQAALSWVVNEMEERYRLLAKIGSRNIESYNEKVKNTDASTGDSPKRLPYIIIIIDELADLMAVAQQNIENAIMRLAQLSRAVGIHMVLATQRPSVDVITGVIKANFPARISFKVASKVDSRTVLDMNGADKLLGRGDMLFIEPGASKPVRAQGSLVSDKEIDRVVSFIKSQGGPVYNEEIINNIDDSSKTFAGRQLEKDELYDEAVRIILESKQASVSILQRRLGLGYTRAARIIDFMEQEGIVGPYRGSKPREILVDKNSEIEKENV
ncbi:MAG: DNA translocase FtsK [Patescibacteria group bacterium]|nr:DNA translocase FtsK [Patescibacteria group bacterium]